MMINNTIISSNSEWGKLYIDPPVKKSWWFSSSQPPQPQPGQDLRKAVDLLARYTLLDRTNNPGLEEAYQKSVNDVYVQFKARVSQFELASTVSKGVLLKGLVGASFQTSPATIDLLMQKHCKEEIEGFRLNLQSDPLTEVGRAVGHIGAGNILSAIHAKITDLAGLYSAPSAQLTAKTEKELYQSLLKRYKSPLETQIEKLKKSDPLFKAQLEAAFIKDIKKSVEALKSGNANAKKLYSEEKERGIQERLTQMKENLVTQEEQIKNLLQSLKPELLKNFKGFLESDLTLQTQLLQPSTLSLPLSSALKSYRMAAAEVHAKQEELALFLSQKQQTMTSLKTESDRYAIFQASASERGRYISHLMISTKEQYQQLLFSLNHPGRTSSPSPTLVSSLADATKKSVLQGGLVLTMALGVCAVYAGLYYGGSAVVASVAATPFGSSIGARASTAACVIGEVAGNCAAVARTVMSVSGNVFSALYETTVSRFVS